MKIVRFSAKNVKRIKAVEISPDGNVIVIGGRNGQGKSSILDSIAYALGGKDVICREPVRRGQEEAEIVCDLGDLVVTRTFTADGGGELKVEGKDGAEFKRPQAKLDDLIGRLSFDPLEFARANARSQAETLRELVGLDFTAVDSERERIFAHRTEVNRDARALEARILPLEQHEGVPAEEISAGEIVGRLQEAQQSILRRTTADGQLASEVALEKAQADAVRELEDRLGRARTALATASERVKAAKQAAETARANQVDTEPIKAELESVGQTNRKIRENAARASLMAEVEIKRSESKALTTQLDAISKQKEDLIAAAKFPIAGLGFSQDGVVTMNGLPLDQASQAEQLRVSCAIGLALNPKLRVLLIRDASLLDAESLALVGEMAEAHDAQLWLERVEEGGATVIIEDGSVVVREEPEPAEAK